MVVATALLITSNYHSMHNYHRKKDSKHELERKQQVRGHEKRSAESGHLPVIGTDIIWRNDVIPEIQATLPHPCQGNKTTNIIFDSEGGEVQQMEESVRCRYQYDNWQPQSVREYTNGSLYIVKASASAAGSVSTASAARDDSCDEGEEKKDMITIRLRGQGFLMNQIRLMVSSAVLYARGIIPIDLVHLSLDTPYHCVFPLAPAEGLLLVDSGYSRNVSGQNYCLHPHREEQRRDQGMEAIMTAEEFDTSEKFKESCIYPEIKRDWRYGTQGEESDELVKK